MVVEKKVNTFNVVKVFVVIPRDGNVSLQQTSRVCSIKEQLSFVKSLIKCE